MDAGRIVYVTSFATDMYKATGRKLLDSYKEHGRDRPLLVCHENPGAPAPDFAHWGVHTYDLGNDLFLREWLHANRAVIPVHLGGRAKECRCPDRHRMHGRHKPRCHYAWMNRNASRWFRKVASWRYAAQAFPDSVLLWIDSDAVFKRPPDTDALVDLFGAASVIYCCGKREAAETGLVGFHLQRQGGAFIQDVCAYYTSGQFLKEERWDDGYIVTRRLGTGLFPSVDLVDRSLQKDNEAIPYTPLARWFRHDKGTHGRKLGVMK